ncbi:hypothetical protein BVC80_9055g9 [Macleaya cordata]|uniref:Uncharacterized protein n=1 Tax=Macleaya cordata TaxID=56857 RepID=A0A200R9I5_MACCD|nr:hypothetical protein BVC80_9055g9 [Macleaya cordata]
MASLSIIQHSFYTKNNSIPSVRSNSRISCIGHEPIGFSDPKGEKDKEEKENKPLFPRIYIGIQKLGRGLKDSLSPKQKGDWKDVLLMSLSFAVYVYISQKIVCAYCVWMSMLKQHW